MELHNIKSQPICLLQKHDILQKQCTGSLLCEVVEKSVEASSQEYDVWCICTAVDLKNGPCNNRWVAIAEFELTARNLQTIDDFVQFFKCLVR